VGDRIIPVRVTDPLANDPSEDHLTSPF
jgi:hypothetical protein